MSREKTRRVERLEAKMGSDGEPKTILAGIPLADGEGERIFANWREIVAAGGGIAKDGTRFRARVGGSTLYLMPEPLTTEQWLASVQHAA